LRVMESFSPVVEAAPPDAFYLDITGIDLRTLGRDGPPGEEALPGALLGAGDSDRGAWSPASEGVQHDSLLWPVAGASAGATANPFVARVAAELAGAGAVRIVPDGAERRTLAAVPLAALPCTAEMQRRLHLFGLRTRSELAALPFGPVQAQFGREGAAMWRLARGDDPRQLTPRRLPAEIAYAQRFESPTASAAALRLTLHDLCREAGQQESLFSSAARRRAAHSSARPCARSRRSAGATCCNASSRSTRRAASCCGGCAADENSACSPCRTSGGSTTNSDASRSRTTTPRSNSPAALCSPSSAT